MYKRRTGKKYDKNDEKMTKNGDEEKAIMLAKQKLDQLMRDGKNLPSKLCPATTVFELVGEIKLRVEE